MGHEKSARRRAGPRRRETRQVLDVTAVRTNRMIADFMKTSSNVERHLQQKRSLTELQYDSIVTTIQGLETMLATWRTHFRTKQS